MVLHIIGAVFCELRNIFPSPEEARKNTSNEQNVRFLYVKPSNKIEIYYSTTKRFVIFGFSFLERVLEYTRNYLFISKWRVRRI